MHMYKQGKMRPSRNLYTVTSGIGTGAPIVELAGNHRVLIENHIGITSYGQNEIHVRTKRGIIEICGNELEIRAMSKERIIICGVISGLKLWSAGK